MRIKRLELLGFKSFVDPTVIDFDAPITGVVGPNGCGKSNVVDAIRWVMGEMSAKSLRGRSMEDVIFNGSDRRSPLGMAEVSLTFSTEDGIIPAEYAGFTEITVSRRLYRSGESEYLINRVPSRLRDVVDLFLGTGVGHKAYSIIEQGKIDFVINAKPEERRLLLEEAAGISKFKSRKEAALRRIEATVLNLDRLRDILQEVTRQINALDRQVKKAERYRTLKSEYRDLDLRVAAVTHREQMTELSELKVLLESWIQRETASTADLTTLENEIERGRIDLTERDSVLSTLQERTFEVGSRLKLLEAEQEFRRKEVAGLEESKQLILKDIVEIKGRLETLARERIEQQQTGAALDHERTSASQALSIAQVDCQRLEEEHSSLAVEIERLKEKRHQESSSRHQMEAEHRFNEERQIAFKGQIAQTEVSLEEESRLRVACAAEADAKVLESSEVGERCRRLQQDIGAQGAELESLKERKEILAEELLIRQEDLLMKRSRLKSLLDLEKNFEGYEEGVRTVLQKKKGPGLFGVVADFIETSPGYEMAVGAALGEKLQYVIVQSQAEGVDAIQLLKSESSGRSSFIPIEVRGEQTDTFPAGQRGVIGPLLNLVKVKDNYRKIGQYLLGDVMLVESLGDALLLWKNNGHKKTLVTLEGEVVDPYGIVSGGTTGLPGKALLEKKREIKELKELTAEFDQEISLKEDTLSQLEGQISERTLNYESTRRHLNEEELKRIGMDKELELQRRELTRREELENRLRQTLQDLRGELGRSTQILHELQNRQTDLSRMVTEQKDEITIREEDLARLQHDLRLKQESLTELKIQEASVQERTALIQRETDRLQSLDQDLHQQVEQRMATITEGHHKVAAIIKAVEESTQEISSLKKMAEELAISQEEARTQYESLAASMRDKEEKFRVRRKECDLARSHTGDLRVTLSRLESETVHLEMQIQERHGVALADVESALNTEEALRDFNKESSSERLAELKTRLDQMGDVHLGAISEYEELKTRHEFLSRQIADLESSIDSLKKAIQRINQTTRKRFETTFERVNERFQTLFPRLFRGGRAEMRLAESEDSTLAGVELLVQPPGKKLAHIGLLSGGEKALSAIAFVFSIFLVKPSPFCILDEVDAPLDDLNAERFHNLLSEMVSRTQFILITHNRRTMEKADLLYGVTMQEAGVSQLVSVRMNEALKMAS